MIERQAFIDIDAIIPPANASCRTGSFTGMAVVAFLQNLQIGPIIFGEWMIGEKGIEHIIAAHPIHKNQAIACITSKAAACSQQLQGRMLGRYPQCGGLEF